ncbi:MAG: AMP-binding protein [Planctomycetaceae bacterium]
MHRSQSRRRGPRTALRYRTLGCYRDVNWRDYRQQADNGGSGLIGWGIQPHDRVAILSENRWEWLVADHAMLSCGAVTVPLHAPLSAAQVAYQLGHSGARGLFVSTQAQADKVLHVLDQLPDLQFLVSFDRVDVGRSRLAHATWDGLCQRGYERADAGRSEIAEREAELDRDSLATIIYTSGTTGNPKGVMLTHGNLLSNALSTGAISLVSEQDVLLSWLPYSHIYARTVDHYLTTETGTIVALAASVDTLIADLQSIKPAWITSVPRFYEKIWSSVSHLDPDTRRNQLHAIFGPNMTQLCSGGAPLPRHVCAGFFEADLPLLEGYGLTETSPVISFNSLHDNRIGSVGLALPPCDAWLLEKLCCHESGDCRGLVSHG